jgi:hypothetical protein
MTKALDCFYDFFMNFSRSNSNDRAVVYFIFGRPRSPELTPH